MAIAVSIVVLLQRLKNATGDEAVVLATLVGALIGGAAVVLGSWLNRSYERSKAREELERKRASLKTLITGELVNVAAGLLDAASRLNAASKQLEATGGSLPLDIELPRDMPFTFSLGADLCALTPPAIDALVMARANLEITAAQLAECSQSVGLPVCTSSRKACGLRWTSWPNASTALHRSASWQGMESRRYSLQ